MWRPVGGLGGLGGLEGGLGGGRGAWLEGDGGEGGLGLGRRGGSNQRLSLFSAGSGHSQTCVLVQALKLASTK